MTTVQHRTGGRSARVREAALTAALEVLAQAGPRGASMNEVARRAGIHATSILRRWGTVEALMLDALLTYSQDQLPVPDTGTLRGDLTEFAESLAVYLSSPQGAAMSQTMAAVEDAPSLAEARTAFWKARFDAASVIVDRAIGRGEIPPGVEAQLAIELVIAPLHFRHLLTHQSLDDGVIPRLVDTVVRGLAGAGGAS